jgi:hypothetical protein
MPILEDITSERKIVAPVDVARNNTGIKALLRSDPFFNKSYIPSKVLEHIANSIHMQFFF